MNYKNLRVTNNQNCFKQDVKQIVKREIGLIKIIQTYSFKFLVGKVCISCIIHFSSITNQISVVIFSDFFHGQISLLPRIFKGVDSARQCKRFIKLHSCHINY